MGGWPGGWVAGWGGGWLEKVELMLSQPNQLSWSWIELGNKLSRVGVGGWLDQVGIKLSQLSTKLKLKLKLSLAIGVQQ